jgi:predicted flap endonuclease-1-like 5' DNA nuclease
MKEISQKLIQKRSNIVKVHGENKGSDKNDKNQKQSSNSELLPASIGREDITIIKGIGPSVALRLREHGLNTIEKIAYCTPSQIANIEGIGLISAEKFIENAKAIKKSKNLNNFTQEVLDIPESEIQSNNFYKLEKENEYQEEINDEELDYEIIDSQKFEMHRKPEASSIDPEILTKKITDDKEIENDQTKDIDKISNNQEINKIFNNSISVNAPKDTLEILHQDNIQPFLTSKETLNHIEIQTLHKKITKELELHEFCTLQKSPELRVVFYGIDILALKIVRVKEFLDLIYIIPIKVCPLKGNLIISKKKVDYHCSKSDEHTNHHFNQIIKTYLQGLINSESRIREDCLHEGKLLRFISNYFQINISLKKTGIHKNLFFHSGPLEYKFLIEPIMICQSPVGFVEKLIPFAYQKSTNIHITDQTQLSNLLQYLDQKYFFIETFADKETALSIYSTSNNILMKNLRLYSIPFILYGFVILSFLLFQSFSVLSLLINLGYGALALYGVVFSFIFIKYYKQKLILRDELATPHYQKKRSFNEGNILLIKEELSPKLMNQFIYECLSNNKDSKIISKIEHDNAKEFLVKKETEKAFSKSNLFEFDNPVPSNVNKNSELKQKLTERYSSFLDD